MRLLNAVTHVPVDIVALLRDECLVVRYRTPDRTPSGVLWLPERDDTTQTHWEVIMSHKGADDAAGVTLVPGSTILVTQRRWPRDTHLVTPDDRRVFCLSISAAGVRGIINYTAD